MTHILKKLIETLERPQKTSNGEDLLAIIHEAKDFLEKSWSFTYKGKFSKSGRSVIIKLVDIGMDLDDIFKFGLESNIGDLEMEGELFLAIREVENIIVKTSKTE